MRHVIVSCVGSVLAALQVWGAPSDKDLLLWLPFDEGGGDVAADRSPNGLEADLSNVQWANGTFGTAAHFGGTNAFVDIPAVPGFNGATQFTLSVWATWDGSAARYPNLLTTHTWSPGGLMLFVSDNACSFRMGKPGPGWSEVGAGLLSTLPQHQWTHLCVTFEKPHLTTYVNGCVVSRTTWPHPAGADALRLGGWSGSVCHNGLLDDLRLYGRAFAAAEVVALAHDPARGRADYALADESKQAQPLAATFENRRATLAVDTRGRAFSLRSRASARDLLLRPTPLVTATLKDGSRLTARRAARDGSTLTFAFGRNAGTAAIKVDTCRDFFTFTVESLTLTNAASLTFCALAVEPAKYCGGMANMLSDDADAVCLRGYDLPVEMDAAGRTLRVGTTAEHGLTGWRAGLAAGSKRDMPAMLRAMAESAGVPASRLGGPWSLGAEANRGSYLFADLAYAATDDWIELARRGGFSTVHIHGWWQTLGHYGVNTNLYPRGLADMKDAVARIHEAGLRAGIHTLTACIDPRDAWVTPEASADLLPFDTYTLARALSPTDTVFYVNEPSAAHHDVVFTYMSNGNAIRIGSEIVQYAEVSRTPPYAFSKCTRGAFKTHASAHAAGERADYLQQRYIAFYPQPDSPLAGDLADHIAAVFNACKLDQIYFDGSEGMMSRYGIDTMRHAIFKRLKSDPLVEASCHGAHNWWFHSRLGAWDHPVWAAKRFQDKHIAVSTAYRDTDLLEPQMGWWAPRMPSAVARGHFLDEMEYFACKNLGLDAAMSIQGVNVSRGPLPFHIEKQFTLLGWYEHLRLARYFDTQTVARVAVPGDEFRLRQARDGAWRFTPVNMTAHRISALGNGSEAWTADNAYGGQPLCARIEALDAVAPYESPKRAPVVAVSDFGALKTATATAAVSLTLAEETSDARAGERDLRLRAVNKSGSRIGAWARATLDIPAPYRSLAGNAAFGVWIKGDGSGALLNLQLATPREYMHALSDHYVTLDFTGWRYVELLVRERDVERMTDYVWPYGGAYDIYRNPLDLAHLSQVNLYLNDLPVGEPVDVAVSPVMALPVRSGALKNPSLTVNGQTLSLPFALASGDFAEIEPDGVCTHYSDAGEPLEWIRLAPAGHADAGPSPREGILSGETRVGASACAFPVVAHGVNRIAFICDAPSNANARADVTLSVFGEPFGTPNPRRMIDARQLTREYGMPRRIATTNAADNAWEIAVRPGERARLEIEIAGALENPALAIFDRVVRFPVALKAGERLFCGDGRHWRVLDAKRAEIARGTLGEKVPSLGSGSTRVAFDCQAPAGATVRLVKVYE